VNWLNRKKARNRLGVSEPVLNALIKSGLLGNMSPSGLVSDQAILSYQRFGTQWEITVVLCTVRSTVKRLPLRYSRRDIRRLRTSAP
jgi:hypothetical protein